MHNGKRGGIDLISVEMVKYGGSSPAGGGISHHRGYVGGSIPSPPWT